ncbi:hypothetical protein B879_04181 [Cecembia lonarensis LW9]|uniref:DUF304 domain-containing protein n=2 Tax=Cecembia TaxID=1187078 RepID=K1LSZ3_CECL9|nr:hypothetical protein B879_04181 [Cecembia lonarensis LW9]
MVTSLLIAMMFLKAVLLIEFEKVEPIDIVNIIGLGYFTFLTLKGIFWHFIICENEKIIIYKFRKQVIDRDSIDAISVQYGIFGKLTIRLKDGILFNIDTIQLNRSDIDFLLKLVPNKE